MAGVAAAEAAAMVKYGRDMAWQGHGGSIAQEGEVGMGKVVAWVSRPWMHLMMSIVLLVAKKTRQSLIFVGGWK